jgi:hypothetical protein
MTGTATGNTAAMSIQDAVLVTRVFARNAIGENGDLLDLNSNAMTKINSDLLSAIAREITSDNTEPGTILGTILVLE